MITPSSVSVRSDLFSAPREGLRKSVEKFDETSERIADGDTSPDNVAGQIQAEVLFKANAISLRTADGLIGSLLNVKA